MRRDLTRRELLLGGAGFGALLGVMVSAGPARAAMSRQTLAADSELGIAYANRCAANPADGGAHAQLIGDLQAALMGRAGFKGQVLTQTAVCPFCGCPVTATRVVD